MEPGLFGIKNSNRNFNEKAAWGKNQFNCSFPAALCNYIDDIGEECVYIKVDSNYKREIGQLKVQDLYNIDPCNKDTFFAFESQFSLYRPLVVGSLPRIDLVIQKGSTGFNLSDIEIKLTALPDNSTCELHEEYYGCEIVVRPDTIVYLACSIAHKFKENKSELKKALGSKCENIEDWSDGREVLEYLPQMISSLITLFKDYKSEQTPLVLQPVWKTEGKSPKLADHCLDSFVWSNFGFTKLFIDPAIIEDGYRGRITRTVRTSIWLYKMLFDFASEGQFDHNKIIDRLSFNTKMIRLFQ